MRTVTKLKDVQVSLFRLRVERGIYLSDVTYDDLCREEHMELMKQARLIVLKTELELRRVQRHRKKVWRFMNKNGL